MAENTNDQAARPWQRGGPSPNPGGRPRGAGAVRELAQRYSDEALLRLVQIMRSSPRDEVRVRACEALLDRAWGRPVQGVVAQVAVEQHIDPEQLRASIAERLVRLAAAEPTAPALPTGARADAAADEPVVEVTR